MIKQKLKPCSNCNQDKIIWKNHEGHKFCKACWFKVSKPSALKVKSKKKSQEDSAYSGLRKVFLLKHPTCAAKLQDCTIKSTDVHHKKGRTGSNHLDVKTWLSACRSCHDYIELHPTEAIIMGFSESRLKH
jgi:hypothetical protein